MSRHSDIAEAVKDVATTWAATNWTGAQVARKWVLEELANLVTDDRPLVIGIIPTQVTENNAAQGSRGTDGDLVSVSVICLCRAADLSNATLDGFDDKVEALRDYLRRLRSLTDPVADLESVTLETVFDSPALSMRELWASLIVCQYSTDVASLPEVPQP